MAERYRLEGLLALRRREKKRQEILLARALRELNEAKKKLEELKKAKEEFQRKKKEARQEMDRKMANGGLVQSGCFHVNFIRKIKEEIETKEEEIESQDEVVVEVKEKVAKERKNYIEAIKRLRMMEKHKALWEKKVREKISRREEKEMDELGQTIHRLRGWRGEKSVFEAG